MAHDVTACGRSGMLGFRTQRDSWDCIQSDGSAVSLPADVGLLNGTCANISTADVQNRLSGHLLGWNRAGNHVDDVVADDSASPTPDGRPKLRGDAPCWPIPTEGSPPT